MGREVDYPRERVEPFDAVGGAGPTDRADPADPAEGAFAAGSLGSFGAPDVADQAFDRFMEASGGRLANDYETAEIPVHRWVPPRLSGLDVVWLVLAAILVVAVVFVVSIARSSMNSVGVPASTGPAALPKPSSTASTLVIVQVSSSASRATAEASAKDLLSRGFPAKLLKSDDFRPLNKGFYVVYTGFYPDDAAGRAEARRMQSRLPGALIRDVHPR